VPKELAIRIDRMRRLGSAFDRAQAQAQRVCGDIAAEAHRQASEAALNVKSSLLRRSRRTVAERGRQEEGDDCQPHN
jgi:hypothetical protein